MSTIPENLKYAESHEWIETGKEEVAVGISDHAQAELSDVVYVELPEIGREVEANESIAVVESVKAASDIFAPVGGEIVAVNSKLEAEPALVNKDPFGDGWIFKIKPTREADFDDLMDSEAYQNHID